MFSLSRHETKLVMSGKATGAARVYSDCPHKPGNEIYLSSRTIDASGARRSITFAKAQIISVRPGTVGQFRRDPMIAEMDGYANGESWRAQLGVRYKGIKDTDNITHIKFRILQMDTKAGSRPDKEEVDNKMNIDNIRS